jgi:hypothetical protein
MMCRNPSINAFPENENGRKKEPVGKLELSSDGRLAGERC